MCYSTVGTNDAETSALHIIVGRCPVTAARLAGPQGSRRTRASVCLTTRVPWPVPPRGPVCRPPLPPSSSSSWVTLRNTGAAQTLQGPHPALGRLAPVPQPAPPSPPALARRTPSLGAPGTRAPAGPPSPPALARRTPPVWSPDLSPLPGSGLGPLSSWGDRPPPTPLDGASPGQETLQQSSLLGAVQAPAGPPCSSLPCPRPQWQSCTPCPPKSQGPCLQAVPS